ncbi:MAG TPA: YihY/virulence factor BrkB family protein [Thermoanaerobaculia bacterium]|nr:YihY/virulence factor BrkB family protein [Thermoanaerobaculia bacterium]
MATLWTRAGLSWRELGLRLWRQIWEDEVLGRCAELGYFFLFSVFPLLLFLTTLLGYLAGASAQLRWNLFWYIARLSPSREVTALLAGTLNEITVARSGVKLYVSLFAAVWVASNGMIAVGRTLNTAYGFRETRRVWIRRPLAMALTVAFAVLVAGALALVFYGEVIADALATRLIVGPFLLVAWHVVRWPLVIAFLVLSFDMVYNFAPNLRGSMDRSWWTPGGVTGVALLLGASLTLRSYLAYFHRLTTAYGSLGAVILLLLWFYLIGFAILMGGEVNSEIAREIDAGNERAGIVVPRRRRRRLRLRRRKKRK